MLSAAFTKKKKSTFATGEQTESRLEGANKVWNLALYGSETWDSKRSR